MGLGTGVFVFFFSFVFVEPSLINALLQFCSLVRLYSYVNRTPKDWEADGDLSF